MALIPERRGAPAPMNVAKCLGDGVEAGRITREGAERALAAVRRILDETPGIGEGAAAAEAAKRLAAEAATKRRQTAMQVIATDRMVQDAEAHPDGFTAGARGILARDVSGKGQTFNVEGRAAAIRGMLHGMFAEGLEAYRSTALGLRRDTLGLTRFVRQLYGEGTGDGVAGAAAQGWIKATDWAVDRFNAAGGNLAKRETWRLPQVMDGEVLKRMGRTAWLDAMEARIADGRLRLTDFTTGGVVDPLRQAEILSNAYDRISTGGLSDLVPGAGGGTKLANSRAERRAFEWTSADAYLDANRTFGGGDAAIFDLVVGHLDGMAHDIAMLERLGPNPEQAARVLIDTARKRGAEGLSLHRLEATWDHVSGAATSPVSEGLAKWLGNARAWLSSAQLGSAVFSSVTDFSTLRATAAWNGLGANGVMGEYLRLLNPANDADRLLAVRSGLIADGWAQRARAAQRTQMEEIGQTLPNRVAGFVMRASGMEAHTQAAKWAFGMEFLGRLADDAGKGFDALDPRMQRTMARYGVDAAMWDRIRTKGLTEEEGVRWIFPEQIAKGGAAPPAPPVLDEAAVRQRVTRAEYAYNASTEAVMEPDPYRAWDATMKAVPDAARAPYQVHGTTLPRAIELLRSGIDTDRTFHSGPIIAGQHGVDTTRTGNPVLFLSAPGKSVRETGIRYAVLQGPAELARDELATSFPDVRFLTLAEAAEAIRGGKVPEPDGLRAPVGDRSDMEAATRLLEMINTERGFALLEPGAAERALVLGRSKPGTVEGEFLRASAQYKAFPVTMLTRQLMRGLEAYRAGDHGRYMAATAVSLTAMGALAMQLKAVANGRDPRDMTDWKFWGAAFFQGGGAGILGDFLNSALTRADRSFYMTAIGGPTAGLLDDLAKVTGANISATVEGKDARWGRDLANFVRRNTPGTSLWYARLGLDRLLWDRLQEIMDPDHARAFRRTEDRAMRENHQRFWWGPGDRAPERAPDFGAALGAP